MSDKNEANLSIPSGKKAKIVLQKSNLVTYNEHIWVVTKCKNLMGLNPGTIIPEQDIINLQTIPDLNVVLKCGLVLKRND
jgi:hypothetical protein